VGDDLPHLLSIGCLEWGTAAAGRHGSAREAFGDGGEIQVPSAELGCPAGERRLTQAFLDKLFQRHRSQ
jgi:hypothetical protein